MWNDIIINSVVIMLGRSRVMHLLEFWNLDDLREPAADSSHHYFSTKFTFSSASTRPLYSIPRRAGHSGDRERHTGVY